MIDRRTLLEALVGLALAPAALARAQRAPTGLARAQKAPAPAAPALATAFATSPYIYVCPLLKDGAESTCHGEVWFGWIDGSAVVITASKSWKARSLERGLTRNRLWVGDFGRWKQLMGRNDTFRKAPSCMARAERISDASTIDNLLAIYEKKYPSEIANWRGPMRAGVKDGSRLMIRYVPEAAAAGGAART